MFKNLDSLKMTDCKLFIFILKSNNLDGNGVLNSPVIDNINFVKARIGLVRSDPIRSSLSTSYLSSLQH